MANFVITISVDTSVLESIMPQIVPVAERLVKKGATQVESYAKQAAPLDTGALRNSIHTDGAGLEMTVQDGVEYGIYQELGVDHPYFINSPVYISGVGWRYIVRHPGFPAQPFMVPAVERVAETYFETFFMELLG